MRQAKFVSKDGKATAYRWIGILALGVVAAAWICWVPAADHTARAAAESDISSAAKAARSSIPERLS